MANKPTAAPAEQPVKPPEPPITITEIKPPGKIEVMETGDYVPSAEDLARLAKNQNTLQQVMDDLPVVVHVESPVEPPVERPLAERMAVIPPSVATRTMAEMEAGRKVVERRLEERKKHMAG